MEDIIQKTFETERAMRYFEKKLAFTLGPVELKERMAKDDVIVVDVRKKEDYDKGHIPNAISIPKSELKDNLAKLSKDKVTAVYCYTQQCHLAARAALILAKNGYPVMEIEGGIAAWKDYGFDLAT